MKTQEKINDLEHEIKNLKLVNTILKDRNMELRHKIRYEQNKKDCKND